MSSNKKTLIDGDFQVGSAHFYVDVDNNRVGLNQANPTSSLDVNGDAFIATDMTVASNVTVGSNVIAQKFTGSASGLTSVPADQISGVIPVANGGTGTTATTGTGSLVKSDNPTFTGTVTADTFSGSGASLTNIPMGEATGTLAVANGGTGVTTSTGSGNTVLSASPTLTGTVTAETANFSSNISVSSIHAGYDTDTTSYLGRAAVGFSGVSDEATFAHVDVNSTNNYALKQSATGGTQVNAATGEAVIFSINDSEQARINTTGLGVGIDIPAFKLDVDGTANVGVLYSTFLHGDGSNIENIAGYSWPTHLNGNDIYYTTGNVGIGTATPDNTLEVAGTASVPILKSAADAATSTYNYLLNGPRPGTTSDGAVHFINGSTRTTDGGASTYTIRNNSGNLLLGIASYDTLIEGNVGIGEDNPGEKIQINGNIGLNWSDNTRMIMSYDNSYRQGIEFDAATRGMTLFSTTNDSGGDIIFKTRAGLGSSDTDYGTERMCINSSGNVGIGSAASATNRLKVNGTVEATSFSGIQVSDVPTLNQDTTGEAGSIAGQANSATIAASADAGNNTIVRRSPSGYVFANYFNTTADDVSSGVTRVMVETGNDNYIRHGTADAIKTFLGLGDYAYKGNGSNITRTSHSNGFLVGSYNSVAANDQKTNPIYTIGSNYMPSDTSLSNMYGIGYSHGNFTSYLTGGWGMYVVSNGGIRIGLNGQHGHIKCSGYVDAGTEIYVQNWFRVRGNGGIYWQAHAGGWNMTDSTYVRCYNNKIIYTGGSILAGGNVTAYSDIRRKKDLLKIDNALDKVEELTGYTYTSKLDNKRYTGLIAQDVQKVLPEAVNTETDGHLSLAYGNMVGLLVEAVKELTRKNEILEARLNVIENNK